MFRTELFPDPPSFSVEIDPRPQLVGRAPSRVRKIGF